MFDDERFYQTDDDKLTAVWPAWTLAKWRSEGRGPPFFKYGRRVHYSGRDLNEFLAEHRVEPVA